MFEIGDRVTLQVYTPGERSVEWWPAHIVKVSQDSVTVKYLNEEVDEYGDEHDVMKTLTVSQNDPNIKLL